jgi:hypothetical protein
MILNILFYKRYHIIERMVLKLNTIAFVSEGMHNKNIVGLIQDKDEKEGS